MAFISFFLIVFSGRYAAAVFPAWQARKALPAPPEPREKAPAKPAKAAEPPAGQRFAQALAVLGMLQREGRLIDFLQEEVAPFTDAEVGAAARVVHEGCRKVVRQYLSLEPVLKDAEGAKVTVPKGFDAARIRLTGNVAGEGPYSGSLKHPGWVATEVRLPTVAESIDPRVLAPAEIELA
jgi:hypothetical protein